jgi:hypothetical protein
LLRFQFLRESFDIGRLETTDALVVDQRVQARAFESPHGRDADAETLGDVIARERCQFQVVLALFCGQTRRHVELRHPKLIT